MNWPRISVVTPSFNQVAFLETTLKSVLDQNYPALEYLVMDGGSTDGTDAVLRAYGSRLAHVSSAPDGGHYAAVRDGFARATGEIHGWLNSDDIYLPWTLRTVGQIFAQCPEVEWISSRVMAHIDGEGAALPTDALPGFSRAAFLEGKFLLPMWKQAHAASRLPKLFGGRRAIQQESTFWRRSLWEKTGGLDPRFTLAGDFELWSRFWRETPLYAVPAPLACFRSHGSQRSAAYAENYYHQSIDALIDLRRHMGWNAGDQDWLGRSRTKRIGSYTGSVLTPHREGEWFRWKGSVEKFAW